MPRIRSLKPECWQDAGVGRLSRDARLLFIGLITQADDEGRLVAELPLLRALIFPYDPDFTLDDLSGWLAELDGEGLVILYGDDGDHFAALPRWHDHQKINRKTKSRIPEPPEKSSRRPHGAFTEASPPEGIMEGIKDRNGSKSLSLVQTSSVLQSVVRRFRQAEEDRGKGITVDEAGIGRVMDDFSSVPHPELVAFACAEWMAGKRGMKRTDAAATLRNFFTRELKDQQEGVAGAWTSPTSSEPKPSDPVTRALGMYVKRFARFPAAVVEREMRGHFVRKGELPSMGELLQQLEKTAA